MQKNVKKITRLLIILFALFLILPAVPVSAGKTTTYTVTYNANGGKKAPKKQRKKSTKKSIRIKLTKVKPVRQGYTFTAWNTKKNGSGKSFKPGANVKLKRANRNLKLYALWKQNKTTATEKTSTTSVQTTQTKQNTQTNTTNTSTSNATSQQTTSTSNSKLEVHYIDVGQGDATLLICDGEAMLIDAGDNSKGTAIQSYLQSKGVKELKYAVATHPDADHIGGMDVVITKFNISTFFMPNIQKDTRTYDDVVQALKYKNLKAVNPSAGSTYKLGSATVKFVSTGKDYGDKINNWSLCMKVTHGNTSFLFVGDAEEEAERDMLNSDIKADVYMTAHHGSRTGSIEDFVKKVNPMYAVISCGKGNSYGHPHSAVLNTLRSLNVKIYRTDEQGTIIATSDGKTIKWSTSPSTSWLTGNQSVTDEEGDYILNTNSKVFHKPSCASVANMSDKNKKVYSGKKAALLQDGYKACGSCKP